MRPETLQAALTKEQREAGLYLDEPDDHTLLLKREGQGPHLAAWYQTTATIKDIRETANHYMTEGRCKP